MQNRRCRGLPEVLRDGMIVRDKIVDLLDQEPRTIPQIAEIIGYPSREVLVWVMGMWRYGAVEATGKPDPEGLLKKFIAVILRDKQDHPQVKKRIEISREILCEAGVKVEEVFSLGKSLLARTFSLIYISDYVSFYLAILNGEDPTPVKRIDYLKKRLKQWK